MQQSCLTCPPPGSAPKPPSPGSLLPSLCSHLPPSQHAVRNPQTEAFLDLLGLPYNLDHGAPGAYFAPNGGAAPGGGLAPALAGGAPVGACCGGGGSGSRAAAQMEGTGAQGYEGVSMPRLLRRLLALPALPADVANPEEIELDDEDDFVDDDDEGPQQQQQQGRGPPVDPALAAVLGGGAAAAAAALKNPEEIDIDLDE